MRNPGVPDALWSRLDGRLWHATERRSLSGIVSDGRIAIEIGDRFRSSFCRRQGGLCLFDFGATAEWVDGRSDQWTGWLGSQQGSRIAIWLEVHRAELAAGLWDAATARSNWHKMGYGEFIHGVEACHIGPIPLAAVIGVVLISRDNPEQFQQFEELNAEIFPHIAAFEQVLPPERKDPVIEALLAGRRRNADSE